MMNYNSLTTPNQLIIPGTNITNASLSKPTSYNFAIKDGYSPGFMPTMMIQNIEGSQNTSMLIDFAANVSTTFAATCM